MEIISTLSILFLFTFFYYLGRRDEDYPLEFLGAFGIFLIGVMVIGLGMTTYHIAETGTVTNYIIPTTEAYGWLVMLIGLLLLFMSWRTVLKIKKVL